MSAQSVDIEAIAALAAMTADDLGESEEDVKVRFVVPLLHALGHTKLRFEHKGIDVLLKTGLPRGSAVVVETKRPDASLDAHLEQIERYSFEARSMLSVLTNGRVLRVYAPFWNRAATFAETLVWEFPRRGLAQFRHTEALASVLSRDALASKAARAALEQRQATGFPPRRARGAMAWFTISKGHNPRPRLMTLQRTSGAEKQHRGK